MKNNSQPRLATKSTVSPFVIVSILIILLSGGRSFAQNLSPRIANFSPSRLSMHNAADAQIRVGFDRPIDASSITTTSFLVYGDRTGFHAGKITYISSQRSAVFEPATRFSAGELVTVILTRAIRSSSGASMANPFQWTFYIQTVAGLADFALDAQYETGRGPHHVELADFNGDGQLEPAIPHSRSDNVYVWLNQGNGRLSLNQSLEAGDSPRILTVADFDRDGDLDLAVANDQSNSVSILDNTGSGNFVVKDELGVGSQPEAISHGDLNGDGFVDIVVANDESNSISLIFNAPNGQFQNEQRIVVGANPKGLAVADFNNDGFPDIFVTNGSDETLVVLVNNGSGTFAVSQTLNTGQYPRAIMTADFNGDGLLDLAVTDRDDDQVAVFLQNGGRYSARAEYAVGTDAFAISAGDLDGDGDQDLAVSNRLSNNIHFLVNGGQGNFQVRAGLSTRQQPRGIQLADLNGDGVLDLAVANWESEVLQVFLNRPQDAPNLPPTAPQLVAPLTGTFLNPDSTSIILTWQVPTDPENDALHFKVEVGASRTLAPPLLTFDSAINATRFDPRPPLTELGQRVSLTITEPLPDGNYWWRVTVSDPEASGPASEIRKFTIDQVVPLIQELILPSPAFQPNWFNPLTNATIDFGIRYEETRAATAVFELGTLGGMQSRQLSSGSNQTVSVPIEFEDATDGVYPLSVVISDSTGNKSTAFAEIALDGSPPNGATASAPDTSVDLSFSVNWIDTGNDGTGAGLSGIYDVRMQKNGGEWQDWKTNFEGASAIFEGEHQNTYSFEVAAYDHVGNRESFLAVAESHTVVDTNANDITAPRAPPNLAAGGSNPSPWQSTAEFQISWTEPADPSGVVMALYKLDSPPVSDFDTTGSVVGSTLKIVAAKEGIENFYLWFVDGRGNVNFNNHASVALRYDDTPPDLASLSFPDAQFEGHWFNQALSTKAEIKIEYSEARLQDIRIALPLFGAPTQVVNPASGSNLSHNENFDIADKVDGEYLLTVTLTDSAANQTTDSIRVALDSTAPMGTQASSSDTSTGLTFAVDWRDSGSDGTGAGLSGQFDVRLQINGGAWESWLTNFTGTSAQFTGELGMVYGFEVAAFDNLGSREAFLQLAETTTVIPEEVDSVPPIIVHNPPMWVDEGKSVSIQAQIEDNSQVTEATLHYKSGGSTTFSAMPMIELNSGEFQATLAAAQIPISGINYFIRAFDGNNTSFHPASNWQESPSNLSVRVAGSNNQGLSRNEPLTGGLQPSFFRMVSVPLQLDNPDPLAVLMDDLGPYDQRKWRLFQYKSGPKDYVEYPDIDAFLPGKAFWLIVAEPGGVVDSGLGTSVASNAPFVIDLQQGWNDFALPFSFPVQWSDVQIIEGNAEQIIGPYTYQEEWMLPSEVTTLLPWEGYSVYSESVTAKIAIHPIQMGSQPSQHELGKTEWQLRIDAVCENAYDRATSLGVARAASVEWDKLDFLEPPRISDYVSVSFLHNEWQFAQKTFTTDVRPLFEDGQVWTFQVETNIRNKPVVLSFTGLEVLSQELDIFLIDRSTLRHVDLRQQALFTFVPNRNESVREFDLVVGTTSYIEDANLFSQEVPESFSLSQNYPNPFNAGTTFTYKIADPSLVKLTVLNVLGQKVRGLLDQNEVPGTYRVIWDGSAADGRPVSSGIYMVQFEAGSFRQTRKVLLVR